MFFSFATQNIIFFLAGVLTGWAVTIVVQIMVSLKKNKEKRTENNEQCCSTKTKQTNKESAF